MTDKVDAPCHRGDEAAHHGPARRPEAIRYVIIHSAEATSARGVIAWFANPRSLGSAHLAADDAECWRSLDDLEEAYQAPPLNEEGWGIELCGFASWSRLRWLTHPRMLNRAARKVAVRCRRFGIPPRFLGNDELRAGKRGMVTHRQVTEVYHVSTHTDPGPSFPRYWFARRVRYYFARLAP